MVVSPGHEEEVQGEKLAYVQEKVMEGHEEIKVGVDGKGWKRKSNK